MSTVTCSSWQQVVARWHVYTDTTGTLSCWEARAEGDKPTKTSSRGSPAKEVVDICKRLGSFTSSPVTTTGGKGKGGGEKVYSAWTWPHVAYKHKRPRRIYPQPGTDNTLPLRPRELPKTVVDSGPVCAICCHGRGQRKRGRRRGQHLPREAARDGYFTSAVHGVQGGLQDGHPGHDDGGEGAAPNQWRARHDHAALLHRAGGREEEQN